jgi:hypothetical protein
LTQSLRQEKNYAGASRRSGVQSKITIFITLPLLVAAALHQDIEHVIVLVDSAPQVMALAIDGQKDLVEVPLVPWLGASTLQLIRVVLPKLQTPLADGWVCPTFYTLGSSAS